MSLRNEATLLSDEHLGGDRPLEGRLRRVIALDHLRSLAAALDELLLGEEVVREAGVEGPDRVQQLELGLSVESQVADELAHMRPVLLLDVGAVVLVARAATA